MDKELSVFIDESGDFGTYEKHCPFYIVSLVLHDQRKTLDEPNRKLDEQLSYAGLFPHSFHTMPLIRGDLDYHPIEITMRRKLLGYLFTYMRAAPVHYSTVLVEKRRETDVVELTASLTGRLRDFIADHIHYFNLFDKIIVYYDNGQVELTRILVAVFTIMLRNVEFRRVEPSEYRLFQVADLCCTMELIRAKLHSGNLNKSEKLFFGSNKDLKKNYLKHLDSIRMP